MGHTTDLLKSKLSEAINGRTSSSTNPPPPPPPSLDPQNHKIVLFDVTRVKDSGGSVEGINITPRQSSNTSIPASTYYIEYHSFSSSKLFKITNDGSKTQLCKIVLDDLHMSGNIMEIKTTSGEKYKMKEVKEKKNELYVELPVPAGVNFGSSHILASNHGYGSGAVQQQPSPGYPAHGNTAPYQSTPSSYPAQNTTGNPILYSSPVYPIQQSAPAYQPPPLPQYTQHAATPPQTIQTFHIAPDPSVSTAGSWKMTDSSAQSNIVATYAKNKDKSGQLGVLHCDSEAWIDSVIMAFASVLVKEKGEKESEIVSEVFQAVAGV